MTRALVLTTEPLPLPGLPATGAGLRAWGLAQGLRAAGLDVTIMMPADAAATFAEANQCGMRSRRPSGSSPLECGINEVDLKPASEAQLESRDAHLETAAEAGEDARAPRDNPQSLNVGTFDRSALPAVVRRVGADVIVLQHWGLARELGEVDAPLAMDLAGPHLLERRLWGSAAPEADLGEKLDALRRADFLTASGERQRLYFLPYLGLAGWDLAKPDLLPVIPFSMKAAAAPAPARGDRLIYGGFFLPWQDPTAALEEAMAALDRAGRGELLFIGGAHPRVDVSRGRFDALLEKLRRHPRVRLLEPMSFDRYQALLAEGGVALDLMAPNPERELAYTTRTVVYMAQGLPVIHDNYSELGELIARRGAGWALSPSDRAGLGALLDGLLRGEIDPAPQGRAAHELVENELDWEKTAGALAEFCRTPHYREGKTSARLAFEERDRRLQSVERELEQARAELATLRGKRWVRWGLALAAGRTWRRWPAAALAAVVGLALTPVFWVNDWAARMGGRGKA